MNTTKREQLLEDCLNEAIELMEQIIIGEYTPDSFTTQPWTRAIRDENQPLNDAIQYISITDQSGRTSTLDLGNPDTISVIGVLPHNSEIYPKTPADADKLIRWLTSWASTKDISHDQS